MRTHRHHSRIMRNDIALSMPCSTAFVAFKASGSGAQRGVLDSQQALINKSSSIADEMYKQMQMAGLRQQGNETAMGGIRAGMMANLTPAQLAQAFAVPSTGSVMASRPGLTQSITQLAQAPDLRQTLGGVPGQNSTHLAQLGIPDAFNPASIPSDTNLRGLSPIGDFNASSVPQGKHALALSPIQPFNPATIPTAAQLTPEVIRRLNDVPDWQQAGAQVQNAFNAAGQTNLAQHSAGIGESLAADAARRGLGGSTIDSSNQVGLMNWARGQEAMIAPQALQARHATEAALRGEGTQNALTLQNLTRQGAEDQLARFLAGEQLGTSRRAEQAQRADTLDANEFARFLAGEQLGSSRRDEQSRRAETLDANTLARFLAGEQLGSSRRAEQNQWASNVDAQNAALRSEQSNNARVQQEMDRNAWDAILRGQMAQADHERGLRGEARTNWLQDQGMEAALRQERMQNTLNSLGFMNNENQRLTNASDLRSLIAALQGNVQGLGQVAQGWGNYQQQNNALWNNILGGAGTVAGLIWGK